jgi:hypothetical protein
MTIQASAKNSARSSRRRDHRSSAAKASKKRKLIASAGPPADRSEMYALCGCGRTSKRRYVPLAPTSANSGFAGRTAAGATPLSVPAARMSKYTNAAVANATIAAVSNVRRWAELRTERRKIAVDAGTAISNAAAVSLQSSAMKTNAAATPARRHAPQP